MDKDLARIVLVASVQSTRAISEIVPLLKQHCDQELHTTLSLAIATAIAGIQLDVMDKVYEIHPDLKTEVETRYEKYGRLC